ncbi:MAG: HutD family protein [Acidovorax sp.]|nr:MAG: HutD family protein [Acidovorax sp.]
MNFFDLATIPNTPWKNGGGSTQELACWPPGADMNGFEWRVSLATVDRPGPFSVFPAIDRQIMLLGGDGLHLRSAGWEHALDQRWQPFAFSGDDAVDGAMLGGTSKDFNLMLRRGVWQGALQVVVGAQSPAGVEAGFCMALRGDWRWMPEGEQGGQPRVLRAGQGFWWASEGEPLQGRLEPVHSAGSVAAVAGAHEAADGPALVWIALERASRVKF